MRLWYYYNTGNYQHLFYWSLFWVVMSWNRTLLKAHEMLWGQFFPFVHSVLVGHAHETASSCIRLLFRNHIRTLCWLMFFLQTQIGRESIINYITYTIRQDNHQQWENSSISPPKEWHAAPYETQHAASKKSCGGK